MNIEDLGYNKNIENQRLILNLEHSDIGRVISEHKERYIVRNSDGEFEAEITGNIRFTANSREDFPAVGDWVTMKACDSDFAVINGILPRSSVIKRQSTDQSGQIQIIATNIDYAFIIQSADNNFNINRLERYLTICHSAMVEPVIILSKTDLIDSEQLVEYQESIKRRIKDARLISISNFTGSGYADIESVIEKGKTYCMLGSSGVGKSTMLNNLAGNILMKTDNISQSTSKGKHTTSHRQLFILKNGGIIIDNPGMREIGIADSAGGLSTTFESISELGRSCRFSDCTHTGETGCAVLEAIEKGKLDRASYENYLKMKKESFYFEANVAERRKRDKNFGKMLKDYKKTIGRQKNSGN